MWINEKCKIITFPGLQNENIGKESLEYVKKILALSHNTQVYIAIEPAIIPTEIRGIKRFLVIEPLSAIVCDIQINDMVQGYTVVEPVWIEAVKVFPYSRNKLCGLAECIGINSVIKIDKNIGLPYICVDVNKLTKELAMEIIKGGFIEILKKTNNCSICHLEIVSVRNWLTLFIRSAISNYFHNINNCSYTAIAVDNYVSKYYEIMVLINNEPIAAKIGKGYVFSADINNNVILTIYLILLLITFTTEISSS